MKSVKLLGAVGGLVLAGAGVSGGAAQAQTATVQAEEVSQGQPAVDGAAMEQEIQNLRRSLAAAEQRISALEASVAAQGLGAQTRPAGLGEPLVAQAAEGARLSEIRAGGAAGGAEPPAAILLAQNASPQDRPVGEAPAPEPTDNIVAALPDNSGVLTREGHWTFDPSVTYSRSSSNRLVFRGVEIVTGVQIGVIEANSAQRDTVLATAAVRYGLTSRSELEVRVPYIHRNDRITTVAQRDATVTQTQHLDATDLGDVEFIGRYQLNRGGPDSPIIVANLRVKSDTGSSPYEVARDQFGVAQKLAVGSGFWAVEPSLSALLVTDPAVVFANISYLRGFSKNINRMIGNVLVGRVTPGDSIGASLGFGFSLNPRFSYSLGYRHSYIFGSKSELGGTLQKSESLQVGSLLFGMSYQLTPTRSINTQFEFGVTAEAPDVSISFRMPFSY